MPAVALQTLRPKPLSLGGGVFAGLLLFAFIMTWVILQDPRSAVALDITAAFLTLALVAYVVDGLSERFSLTGSVLTFSSLIRRSKVVDLCRYRELLLVHEGLNLERGITSVVLKGGPDGEQRLPLGPFWHEHELEAFFAEATKRSGTCRFAPPKR